VTLAGRHLSQSVTWQGEAIVERVQPRAGYYLVRVRRQSAAMLSVPLTRSGLAG
jgi:hypothetical protein